MRETSESPPHSVHVHPALNPILSLPRNDITAANWRAVEDDVRRGVQQGRGCASSKTVMSCAGSRSHCEDSRPSCLFTQGRQRSLAAALRFPEASQFDAGEERPRPDRPRSRRRLLGRDRPARSRNDLRFGSVGRRRRAELWPIVVDYKNILGTTTPRPAEPEPQAV